jgi:trimethylamine---corrinoid protein Co-methyltransferase
VITDKGIIPIKGGQYKLLSDDQLKDLHNATVEVLNEVGVKVLHPEAREMMRGHGCKVDHEKAIVKIPESVLMKFLAKAPSRIRLCGRDPKYDIPLDNSDNCYVMGGAGALNVLDLDSGLHRPVTMKDLEDLTRLEDTLEFMDISHFLVWPNAGPGSEMTLFAHLLKNNTRNFYALIGGCAEGLRYEMEMASVLTGSVEATRARPFFVAGLCIISPLTHRKDFVDELLACGEQGIPAYVEADSIAGGTAPYTISGCAVEINANILAAIALAQMAHPGAPCIYASSSGILDIRSLDFAGCAPESTLLHMVSAQLAHRYNLPYYGTNTPDSKLPDAQMGYERAQHFLGCAMAGVNIIHVAIGNLEMMKLASYEQCLMDNEILGATARFLRGVDCSRDAIGLDAFREKGHSATFLDSEHTVRFMRKERWEPRLTNRQSWNAWTESANGKDMRERARDEARKILAAHHPEYVTMKQAKEIDRLAERARKALAQRGTNA